MKVFSWGVRMVSGAVTACTAIRDAAQIMLQTQDWLIRKVVLRPQTAWLLLNGFDIRLRTSPLCCSKLKFPFCAHVTMSASLIAKLNKTERKKQRQPSACPVGSTERKVQCYSSYAARTLSLIVDIFCVLTFSGRRYILCVHFL